MGFTQQGTGHHRAMDIDAATAQRFWNQVKRGRKSECWPWTGRIPDKRSSKGGYGRFRIKRREYRAHRIAYELEHGPVPDGRIVCHKCDNRACCNPRHLYAGTHKSNTEDMVRRGRQVWAAPLAKLNWEIVREIRAKLKAGEKGIALAAEYGVDPSTISAIRKGRTWRTPDLTD